MVIATLLAAMLPTDSESGHLDPWKALHSACRSTASLWLASYQTWRTAVAHTSQPAHCGRSFTSIHQEFMWLPHQILEPTSHTPFSLMSSSTCLNHLVPSHLMHLFPLNFNYNSLLSILVQSILVTWPNHCNLTLFCGLLSNISIIYFKQALTKDTAKSMSL